MSNALALFMLALCWVVPEHFPPWTAFHTEAPAFAAAVIGLGFNWNKSGPVLQLPAAIGVLLVLALIVTIQWGTGYVIYGGDALVSVAYLGTVACAWLWGYQWQLNDQQGELLDSVCVLIIFAGLMTAFQALTQWLQVEYAMNDWVLEGLRNGRPRANVGQSNQAATTMLMASVSVAVLRQRVRIGSLVMWATLALLGLAITLTQSRTGLLSAVILAIAFHVFSGPVRNGALSRSIVWLWLSLILLAAWSFPHWNLDAGATGGLGIDQLATVGTRPLIWMQLLIALSQHPWLGWGWLQVATAHQAGALVLSGVEQTNYAHNIILDIFLYVGIPLGCLVLAFVGWWIRRVIRNNRDCAITVNGFFLLIPLLVHSLLELPHAYAYFLVVAGILLGAMDSEAIGSGPRIFRIKKWVIPTFFVAWTAFLLSMGYEYVKAEEDFRINRFENRRIGVTPATYEVPRLHLLTQLGELLQVMRLRAEPGMSREHVDLILRAAKRYSWAPIQSRAALALALNGRPIEATDRMRVIKALFSKDVYAETVENFLRLRDEKYPELGLVSIP